MTKELKALEKIGNFPVVTDYEKDEIKEIKELLPNSYKCIETALKGLEEKAYLNDNYIKLLDMYDLLKTDYDELFNKYAKDQKKFKTLQIIKNNFRLVGNCLHATNSYSKDGWVFVKEIEDEEELNAWKEVLL